MANSSRDDQVPVFTSPIMSNMPGLLSVALAGLVYAVLGVTLKDGSRYILKIADLNSLIGSWLAAYAKRLVTVYLPQYNIAWSGYLSIRRTEHPYLYTRYPRQLRRLAEELWRIGSIPVVVIIPTLPMTLGNLKDGLRPQGVTPRASLGSNRGASVGLGGQAPQTNQQG
jgi:hypothetical protein